MAGIVINPWAAAVALLTGALLTASCASQLRVELASIDRSETTMQDSGQSESPLSLGEGSSTTSPVQPGVGTTVAGAAPSMPPTTENDGLLAGGIDPATLVTTPEGDVVVQPTPVGLQNRQLPTKPRLAPPASDAYEFSVQPLEGDALQRSTWNELCPVPTTSLRYVAVSFWGFDGLHHSGELIVAANEADNVVGVFRRLHAIRFPIEEMRIVTPSDVVALRTGDGNNTPSYVCRLVTGGTRFSEHALGLAIDINSFQNPYQRGEEVIPALASSYLDRTNVRPGMIVPGDAVGDEVIAAFADIGWEWGGDWNSLKDYQHFARNNR